MSNSQFNEYEILCELFPYINDGIFVDLGSGHYQNMSNTFDLYQLGWHGLCVDMQINYINEHKNKRPRDTCVCTALSDYEGTIQFWGGGLHCTVEKGYCKEGPKNVSVTTFDKIREQHQELCNKCLFCNVDCDYYEHKVFAGMDLALFSPRVFCVESVKKYKQGKQAHEIWEDKLFEHGYRLEIVSSTPINFFYVKD